MTLPWYRKADARAHAHIACRAAIPVRVCVTSSIRRMSIYICHKKCDQIICEREHRCPKNCHYGTECGNCTVRVQKLRTECQHIVTVSCSGNPSTAHCDSPCEKNRSCGHKCRSICGAFCEGMRCQEMVVAMSPCGHVVNVMCSDSANDLKLLNACPEPCNVELKCGHLCKGSCGRCKYGRLHVRYIQNRYTYYERFSRWFFDFKC